MLKVSTTHKQCLLNLTGDHNDNRNDVVTLATEDIHQEITVRTEVRHEPDNVIQTSPSHDACSEERVHTANASTSTHTDANGSPVLRMTPQYGCGQGEKRVRFSEQEPTDSPSTSRLRTSENNGTY